MINDIKKYLNWKNPTFQFSILLVVVVCLSFLDLIWFASSDAERIRDVVNLISVFAITEGFYVLNYYFFKIKNINYLHLGITGSIIFLVVHPTTPWYLYMAAAALAILGKTFIRDRGAPIFNPAALGIALGYLLSLILLKAGIVRETLFESWWGSDLQFTFFKFSPVLWVISFAILGLFIYYCKRFNKLNHAVAYYVTYIGLSFLYYQVKDVPIIWMTYLMNIFTGSFIFLAFVMVSEPKTSPVMKNQQIWLGITGGVILFIFSSMIPEHLPALNTEIPTIAALLVLNYITYIVKSNGVRPAPVVTPVAPQQPLNPPQPQAKVV